MDTTSIASALTAAVTDVTAVGILVFGALAGLWVLRKVIKTLNRS
jgi:hypothetical protein